MSNITFFPVDCGDMTLIRLADAAVSSILIDVNIRAAADDADDTSVRDVASDLRGRLQRDGFGGRGARQHGAGFCNGQAGHSR